MPVKPKLVPLLSATITLQSHQAFLSTLTLLSLFLIVPAISPPALAESSEPESSQAQRQKPPQDNPPEINQPNDPNTKANPGLPQPASNLNGSSTAAPSDNPKTENIDQPVSKHSAENKRLDPQDPERTPTPDPAINPVKNPSAEQILGPDSNAPNAPSAPAIPTKEGEVLPAAGSAVPVAPPKPALPADKAAQQIQGAPSKQELQETAIQTLIRQQVFTPAMQTRMTPLSRAEWADVLIKALKHNTTMFELFPFFRDVPRTHAAYVPIEVAREKNLLTYRKDHGYYYPDRPVTYSEVYESIAHALTGPPPKPEEQQHLLKPFRSQNRINPELAPAIAKMARLRFFVTETGQVDPDLHLHEAATPDNVAPLLASLMHIIERRGAAVESDSLDLASILPGGLQLVVTPSTAVTETQMTPGLRVFFSLVEPALPLPKESRIRAVVRESDKTLRRFVLMVDEIRTPEDVVYRTQAEIVLTFRTRRRAGFIVPGQHFETTTEALPIPKQKVETPAEEKAKPTKKPASKPASPSTPAKAGTMPKASSNQNTKPKK